METMLRKFGLKKVEPRETEARLKLQKELFCYQKCANYGFPHKASCIAHNEELDLLAIGTKDGCIKIYGASGVQFNAEQEFDVAIQNIFFFGTKGTLVTYCSDNTFHLWEVENEAEFHEIKCLSANERFPKASSFCLSRDHKFLYVGSDSGHVYTLILDSFKFSEHVLYQENVMHGAPVDAQLNVGTVESIQEHPTDSNLILIGYNRGLIALYNISDKDTTKYYNYNQQLEWLTFHRNGEEFLTCHTNGSYAVWSLLNTDGPQESMTPYGPFPCKAITKLLWESTDTRDQPFMIFSGGMPKASYGDRHAVSVMNGSHHVALDFSSKIIDFLVLHKRISERRGYGDSASRDIPHSLLVLSEEELVAVDLSTEGWPVLPMPYMATMHATAITCCTHVGKVSSTFCEQLVSAGRNQKKGKVSSKAWPISGGLNCDHFNVHHHDLLITGHEDGSVRIWDVSTTDVALLLKIGTNEIFEASSIHSDESNVAPADDDDDGEDEWPPFRKVGSFDPYMDDLRLAIRKVEMCKEKRVLVVAGTAGQLIVFEFKDNETFFEDFDHDLRPVRLNIIDERANFTWKGNEPLTLKKGQMRADIGFQPICIAQVFPPATCTSISVNTDWKIAAIGTVHGFGIIDYKLRKFVEVKCTLSADLTGIGEPGMSRRKSFKKSLRESFRRLRSRRSERHKKAALGVKSEDEKFKQISSQRSLATASSSKQHNMSTTVIDLDIPKPVERAVEARSTSDVEGSIVRTLYFADTFLINGHTHGPTFWAGTNLGTVYIYQLSVPENERRHEQEVQGTLAKEVHLRHRAPIMSICVLDKNMTPLNGKDDSSGVVIPDMTSGHSVVISSEEQVKIFSLPNLSAKEKFKLTAHEGAKIRRSAFANFINKSDPNHGETCLLCLTNLGEVNIFSLPSLRRQLKADCIRKDNIMGIISCVFTSRGEGFYMDSPSEFSRFSLSARVATRPNCKICSIPAEDDNL